MNRLPKNYKIIVTDDQTETVYSPIYDEACHSPDGASEETKYNYILGCDIEEKLSKGKQIVVLDVGLGLAQGLVELSKLNGRELINYYSVEIDKKFAIWALERLNIEYKIEFISNIEIISFNYENIQAKVILGDANLTCPIIFETLSLKFDAIFQDPFSPKNNKDMWSVKWFNLLKAHSKADIILSTYSASSSVRKTLIHCGWILKGRKGFANKRTSTLAYLSGKTDEQILHQVKSQKVEIIDI